VDAWIHGLFGVEERRRVLCDDYWQAPLLILEYRTVLAPENYDMIGSQWRSYSRFATFQTRRWLPPLLISVNDDMFT